MYDDTIVAISTATGDSGVGIVRLSGPESVNILRRVFRQGRGQGLALDRDIETHRVYYGQVVDPESGERLDEAIVLAMLSPRSYTREDVVEIQCHGGPMPVRRVLQAVLQSGARLAQPGEFTLRAFLNGRLDLAQAEAVSGVIRAKTDRGRAVALKGLEGRLSAQIRHIRAEMVRALAYLEATIDFSEDDIPAEDVAGPIHRCRAHIERLLDTADQGIVARQGVRVAILGRPNAGKSSLLNALLRTDRAIVTEIPGTTRDTLEETADFSGVPVVLIDTAGLTESVDPVERLGIERSKRAMAEADLCIVVVDGSEPIKDADREIARGAAGKPTVVVASKSDLALVASVADLAGLANGASVVATSVHTGAGLDDLREEVVKAVLSGRVVQSDEILVSSPRHKEVLLRAFRHLGDGLASFEAGLPADCTSSDVRAAVDALGEITGETASQDLLETIFSNFCVGK